MEQKAVGILDDNRLMAIATLRPDGWPQTTLASYANEGLLIYFIIARGSQKFANIRRDDRVSIAVGPDFLDPAAIKALSIAAHASEVQDPDQRRRAVEMLLHRHPGLRSLEPPDLSESAVMRAYPELLTILDYSKGFGHSDVLTVSPGGIEMTPARDDSWGFGSVLKPVP